MARSYNRGLLRGNVDRPELLFDRSVFKKDDFSVDNFLQEFRSKGDLETMRDDLGLFFKILRSEMIELINVDYKDFVHLSSNLIGLDKSIYEIQTPLGQLKEEVLQVKTTLDEEMSHVSKYMDQRRQIRTKRKYVENLERMQGSLIKLSYMLGSVGESKYSNIEVICRASSEFGELQFSMSKCESLTTAIHKQNSDKLGELLLAMLDSTFLHALEVKDLYLILCCLRVISKMGKISHTEKLFRDNVVIPGLDKIIGKYVEEPDLEHMDAIYSELLAFIDSKMTNVLILTLKPWGTRAVGDYHFMLNSFWIEVEKRLETNLPSIFAPGHPDVFYQSYQSSVSFLRGMVRRCKCPDMAQELFSHPTFKAFLQKWNLPVYFEIRFQEIAGELERVLNCPEESLNTCLTNVPTDLCLGGSVATWSAALSCWADGIFIREIAHRFLKLCLQILSRYATWVEEISSNDWWNEFNNTTSKNHQDKITHLMFLCSDATNMSARLNEISSIAAEKMGKISSQSLQLIEMDLNVFAENVKTICTNLDAAIVRELTVASLHHLREVSDIPRLYRRTNREKPSKACYYVSRVLREPSQFCLKMKSTLPMELVNSWIKAAFSLLTQQYFTAVNDVLESIKKTEESLRRLKKIRDRTENFSESSGMDDNEKMKYQLKLDVEEYSSEVQQLGFHLTDIEKMSELLALVNSVQHL